MPSTPDSSEIEGTLLQLELLLQFLQLLPDPLCAVLLLCGQQLVKNHPVCFEFLALQLLSPNASRSSRMFVP